MTAATVVVDLMAAAINDAVSEEEVVARAEPVAAEGHLVVTASRSTNPMGRPPGVRIADPVPKETAGMTVAAAGEISVRTGTVIGSMGAAVAMIAAVADPPMSRHPHPWRDSRW